jgi:hypothetical protein
MKNLLILCFTTFFGIFPVFADSYAYTIIEHPYRFSTYYEMQGKGGFEGRAIKSSLSVKATYDLYDSAGNYQAQGVVQSLSLGSFFAWGKDIDVYDEKGQHIGFIDGEILTSAKAKYSFYNEKKEWVATAYLDYSCNGFLVTSSKGERTIAHLRRNFIEHVSDSWDVVLHEPDAIDVRLLKIFSAFAIDYQASFKEDF